MAIKYESLKLIGDRLLRSNIMKGISWDAIIDYVIDFFDTVGAPDLFINKIHTGEIKNFRGKLPCDFVEEVQVFLGKSSETAVSPARYATDTLHEHYNKVGNDFVHNTYSINNNYIFTSLKNGWYTIAYKAIMVDEEGYPMLPADRIFINALEWYIKYKYFTLLWEDGKIEDKRLENAKQEYSWYVGQLESNAQALSLSKAESLFNSFRTLVPRDNEFSKRFSNTGSKEFIRRH